MLVFDNLEDPAQLARPVGAEASPLTLGCRILFTTRQRELGRFHPVEVSVLPEEPALQLLLRHDSRHPVRDDPDHPERPEAKAICRLLGWLPLALELASAFLAEWPDISLADYRKRLEKEGCLPTLDSEVANLAAVNFQPIHEAAVAATLQTQWEALRPGDETARLVFRVAGQFTEAAAIPVATLGLFAGVSHGRQAGQSLAARGGPSSGCTMSGSSRSCTRSGSACTRSSASSPQSLTPKAETPEFRHACARRVAQAFEDFATLENTVRADGVDLRSSSASSPHWSSPRRRDADSGPSRLAAPAVPTARAIISVRGTAPADRPSSPSSCSSGPRPSGNEPSPPRRSTARDACPPSPILRWRTLRNPPPSCDSLPGTSCGDCRGVEPGRWRYIVSGSDDRAVAVWDLRPGRPAARTDWGPPWDDCRGVQPRRAVPGLRRRRPDRGGVRTSRPVPGCTN